MKKLLKIAIPLGIGLFLCWYAYNKLSPEQVSDIKSYFQKADYTYMWLSVLLGALSHISRGFRWLYTLEPMGYNPKKRNAVMAVFIGYLLNLSIPRSGEVSRAIVLKKYENIPFEKSFGTIVGERIWDFLIMISFVFAVFFIQFDLIWDFINGKNPEKSLVKIAVILAVGIPLFLFFGKWISKSENIIARKIKNLLKGFKEGLLSTFRLKQKWKFIAHTIFIWVMYVLMFYVVFFSFQETATIGIGDMLTAFVVGSFAIIFTNGGLGAYPLFVAEILVIFSIDYTIGTALGWIIWLSQFLMILIGGLLSFTLLPIVNSFNQKK